MGRSGVSEAGQGIPRKGSESWGGGTPDERVTRAVDGLFEAYRRADADLGEEYVHLPTTEVIEWKGLANIWHASVDEFRETVEAHREEPLVQETVAQSIEWLSPIAALVRRTVRTTIPDGRSFQSPALFLVVPDRAGAFKVAMAWWGAFPDWFQG
jgi:hypothetical protein